ARRLRTLLQRDNSLHREGSRHANDALDLLRLVHQLFHLCVGSNCIVDLCHLDAPCLAIRHYRVPQRLRPIRISVEGNLPFTPCRLREFPTTSVCIRDRFLALTLLLLAQLVSQTASQLWCHHLQSRRQIVEN